jgi:hypothetical protein
MVAFIFQPAIPTSSVADQVVGFASLTGEEDAEDALRSSGTGQEAAIARGVEEAEDAVVSSAGQVAAIGESESKKHQRRGKKRVGRRSRSNCKKRLLATQEKAQEKVNELEIEKGQLQVKNDKLKIMYYHEKQEKFNLLGLARNVLKK